MNNGEINERSLINPLLESNPYWYCTPGDYDMEK